MLVRLFMSVLIVITCNTMTLQIKMAFMKWYSSCHHFHLRFVFLWMGHLLSPLLPSLSPAALYISHYLPLPLSHIIAIFFLIPTMSAAAAAAAAAAACCSSKSNTTSRSSHHQSYHLPLIQSPVASVSRYEAQKRRDWNMFMQYLSQQHRPPLNLARCSGAHVLEFLKWLDQFGKTKVHAQTCPFFGHAHAPAPCPCPLKQAWGSLDALVGRLRAAFEENGGLPEINPFAALAVRLYIRDVRDVQAKARGIGY